MTARWIFKGSPDPEVVQKLAAEVGLHPIIAAILMERILDTPDLIRQYYRPSLDDLHDPFLMRDMEKAVARILQALQKREKILVYGDYDVDGTTAVALVFGYLRNYHSDTDFYIPDRYKEGYGLSRQGIDFAAAGGFSLLISLDCGIKAVDMTDYAREKGIDLIICDHHLPGDRLPRAVAILNPKLSDCPYPYKELSGCGVGFKLVQALCDRQHRDPDVLYDYLDLVAVSIAADIVPITGENRILAYHGLKKLNANPRAGFEALMKSAGMRDEVNISGIVFGIGPRINASGRMDHAKTAVELLLADDYKETGRLAESLDLKNAQRKNFDSSITLEALKMIEDDSSFKLSKSTVLFKDDWHKGVIGIVASRCLDKHYRPTIILTKANGKATGSARSVDGFDIYEAIAACSDLLEQYGGHMYAAGLTLDLDKVNAFKERFEKIVADRILDEQLIPLIEIDALIDFRDVHYDFFNLLKQMAPFGPGNLQPVFVTNDLHTCGRPRILKEEHLKFTVQQGDTDQKLEAIGFGMAQYYDLVASGMRFSMAYHIEENTFMGNSSLQLRIKDLRFD
jgi:single-stranded-DNA-specific exonuclease